ncbi:histone acetyltransferase KAT6B-like protein [Leptotrombidium deliense]|uniref:Histone acetyltransferase KAT6B-like protein n=1 Tax=Leptotrombidium deliense TaxID=299467 RepID=A0A443SV83_9ACAR|nr:histone acetyltransferase KAT6B-like protein [Leptotrombidium deliense]
MSENSEEKRRGEMILEAIDALRGRKARPDESRICQWLEKRYGLTKEEILGDIKHSVLHGFVLKVKYKDSISYRNPAKFNRIAFDELKTNLPLNATKRVLRTIRQLNKCSSSQTKGASMYRIMNSLHSSKQLLSYDEMSLERILKRAMQSGTVDQLPNGSYILAKPNVKAKKRKSCATPTMSATASSNSNDSCDVENAQSSESAKNVCKKKPTQGAVKRSRPISTRKKSLGPDFLEPSDLGLQYLQDTFEPKCDDCQSTDIDSETNIDGDENDDIADVGDGFGDFAKRDAKESISKDRKQMIINTIRQISNLKTSFSTDLMDLQPNLTPSPREWSIEDVYTFVGSIGYAEEALAFKDQCIDGVSLMLLTRNDVLTGLSMKLGPALKIYGHIKKLQYFCSQQD